MLEVAYNIEKIGYLPQMRQKSKKERKSAFFMAKIKIVSDKISCDVRTRMQERLDIKKRVNHHHETINHCGEILTYRLR